MARRVVERIVGAIVVLWAAATFVFFMQAVLPGSRATMLLNEATGQQKNYSKAQLLPVEEKYGFNKSLFDQYLDYIKGVAHGNLRTSYTQHEPVMKIISEQLGPTLVLTGTALLLAWAIALLLTMATAKRGRFVSSFGSGFRDRHRGAALLLARDHPADRVLDRPECFPVQGGTSFTGLVLPALTLALPLAGFIGQVTRDELEKVLDEPFITSARARGMGDLSIRLRHALRHAVLPAITLSGMGDGRADLRRGDRRDGVRAPGHRRDGRDRRRNARDTDRLRRRAAGRRRLRGGEPLGGLRLHDRRPEVALRHEERRRLDRARPAGARPLAERWRCGCATRAWA